jgi:hypothetical protein
MLKNSIKFLIIIILITSESQIFSYYKEEFYRDYNKYNEMNSRQYNYNDYNSYKRLETLDYKEFQKIESSEEGNFRIEARDEFLNNAMNKETYNLYNRNDNWSLDKNVASNINAYDYCGYKISENKTVESYSYTSKKYEPMIFNNVKDNERKELVSFNMTTTKGDWQIRNEIKNIEYNDKQEIKSLEVKTKDIAGNELEQKIFGIKYEASKDFSRLKDKIKESEEKGNREGYFNFEKLAIGLKEGEEPAKELPKTFQIEIKDPVGEKQIINFEKVNWEEDKIIGFEATVKTLGKEGEEEKEEGIKKDKELTTKDKGNKNENENDYKMTVKAIKEDSGRIMGFNVKIEDGKEAKEINWTKESKVSIENLVGQKIKGINPINIMGSEKVQIGKGEKSTKIAILGVNYTDKGILEKVEVKTKNHEIEYGITNKTNEKNSLKRDLNRLEQISPSITRNELKDKNIAKMKTKELREEVKEIGQKILNKASKILEKKSEIKSSWGEELKIKGRVEIELKAKEDNSYVMVSKLGLENEKGEKVEEVELVIAGGEVKAIGGKINRKDGSKEIKTTKYKEAEITKIKSDGIIDKSVRGIKNTLKIAYETVKNIFVKEEKKDKEKSISNKNMVREIGKLERPFYSDKNVGEWIENNKSKTYDLNTPEYLANISQIEQSKGKEYALVKIMTDVSNFKEQFKSENYDDTGIKAVYGKIDELYQNLMCETKSGKDKEMILRPEIKNLMKKVEKLGYKDLGKLEISKMEGFTNKEKVFLETMKKVHYFRNKLNITDENLTLEVLENSGYKYKGITFKQMPVYSSIFHMFGKNGLKNTKFVSEDGRFEVVFNSKGKLLTQYNDPLNMGTYNFAGSTTKYKQMHTPCDVIPYKYLGNAEGGAGRIESSTATLAIKVCSSLSVNPSAMIYQIKTSIKTEKYKYKTRDFTGLQINILGMDV